MSRTRKAARREQLDLFVAQPAYEPASASAGIAVAEPADPQLPPAERGQDGDARRSAPPVDGAARAESPAAPAAPATGAAAEPPSEAGAAVEPMLQDAAARRRIEEDLGTNLMVEAGAGAGKTTEMVRRMVALVRSARARIEQIAAVTFTRKAAAELRERFQTALEAELIAARERNDAETAARADAALREIDRAFIGTIHSFCARLLRERPLDAGVDPGFRELMASEEMRLRREFWNTHVERLAADGAPRLADVTAVGLKPAQLFTLFETLAEYPDVSFPAEPVPRPDPSRARLELEALLDDAERLMPHQEPDAGWDELQTAIRTMWFYRRLGWEDDVRFLEALAQAFSRPNRIIVARWGTTSEAKAAVKALAQRFSDFASEDGVDGRTLAEWYAYRYPIALAFGAEAAVEYAAERRRSGELSFQDLLMLTAEMLRERTAARAELSDRYRFLLVDEFQDTDPVQAEVLFLLASTDAGSDWRAVTPRPGSLFVVGDPKQSIYRFRRADITLYSQVKARVRTFGAVLELTSNFRSRPPIERFVNATFRRYFAEQATAQQAPFAPMRVVEKDADPQGVFFYTLRKQGRRDLDNDLARQDADRVASWIAARVRAGDRAPGDFMVLTWRKKHLSTYAQAIEARNLPVQVTGAGIGIEPELLELKLLLSALADPGDTRLTIAVLVGLFFGLDYEQLAEHAIERGPQEQHARDRFRFTAELTDPATPVEQALATLRRFWLLARREPADVVLARIVDELGLLPFAAAGELADSRAGALLYVLEAVRSAAAEGDASLTGALAALEAALETEEAEAPLEPGRRDVVRLMNLHQAKGLEAPVVILAEPFGEWNPAPSRHVDRGAGGTPQAWLVVTERGRRWGDTVLARPRGWAKYAQVEAEFDNAERDRRLYVAATRAAEELVVGSYEEDRRSPWGGFFPHLFMHWPRLDLAIASPPERATLEVPATDLEQAVERVRADRAARATPTYYAAPVRRRVHEGGDSSLPQRGEVGRGASGRRVDIASAAGRGAEWGSAVHRALEAAGRGTRGDRLRAVCRSCLIAADRPLDAAGEPIELDELVAVALSVTSSELWQRAERARAAGRLLIEVPFALHVSSEEYASIAAGLEHVGGAAAPRQIIDGVIDLAFRENGTWTIVDYKSDAAAAEINEARLNAYRAQVSMYAAAWERLTSEPVGERVILFTADGTMIRW